MADDDNPLLVPALRAHMGDWIYYITFLKMHDIAARISTAEEVHSNEFLNDLLQRQLTKRSEEIKEYLLMQEQRFFNSIVVGAYGGNTGWYELAIRKPKEEAERLPDYIEGAIGILELDSSALLFAIDGQHRVVGIREAIKESSSLEAEEVAVIFVAGVASSRRADDPEGYTRTRRLFTTLNRYAKPVSKKDIIALDEDDVVAIITRYLLERHPLFDNTVATKSVKSLSPRDKTSFTTIVNLYDSMNYYLNDIVNKLPHAKRKRPEEEKVEQIYRVVENFWNEMTERFAPLREIRDSEPRDQIAANYRSQNGGHLLFRPLGLQIAAKAITELVRSGSSLSKAVGQVSLVPMDIAREPWAGLIWDTVNRRMITAPENQKVAMHLLYYASGGNLTHLRNSTETLRRELAGLLKQDLEQVKLPLYDDHKG